MSMYRFRDTSISLRARPLRRLWPILAVVLAIPSLVLMVVPAEFSVLVQSDGATRWFFNRQFDLPTGDPAVFHDYSLAPLFWSFIGCSLFYFVMHKLVSRYVP
jgi:hypothetical protein